MSNYNVGDYIEIELTSGRKIKGIVMPKSELEPEHILTIKLDNGYNIGIDKAKIKNIELLAKYELEVEKERIFKKKEGLPLVGIFSTGGTIGCKVDYKTGAVMARYDAKDIVQLVPEVQKYANVDGFLVFNDLSENFHQEHWVKIAKKIVEEDQKNDYKGIIVTHGTDTMAYTASALAFMFEDQSKPIILTGAQRSSDRPSSDIFLNLLSSVILATKTNCSEVMVCMHGSISDDHCLAHRGVRVKKLHTSRRDAFVSVNARPLFKVVPPKIERLSDYKASDEQRPLEAFTDISTKVGIVKYYPGIDIDIIDFFVDKGFEALIIEGTGLGHTRVNDEILRTFERASEELVLTMVSQCINGRVNMNVYRTGRLLQKCGVLPSADMTLEAAYGKLCYLLGKGYDRKTIEKLYLTNLRNELSDRSLYTVSKPK